jgi:hypothetical protein
MVETTYTRSSQAKLSKADIERLKKNMKRSTKWIPKIQQAAATSSQKEKSSAEKELDMFLNS